MINLFPDQQILLDRVRESMRSGHRWTLMQSATGSGKTVLASAIISGTKNKGTKSIMVVPRKELLKQSALTFREYDMPFSYIAGGHEMNPFANTYLATMQTLAMRIENGTAPAADLIIADETHVGGPSLDSIITHYKSIGARGVGLSATPLLPNGRGMKCWYDDMVQGESIEWLMKAGRLSRYRMFKPTSDDIQTATKGKRKLVGCEVKHYRENAMGKRAIAYCESISHSKALAARFNAAGIPAANIDGYMTDEERTRIIKAYARREILILCNNMLLTFGFDLKSASGMDATIEVMIDSAYTESLALQMQKWGRVLRKKPEPALIFDHAGNRYTHGLPDDHREWSLSGEVTTFGSSGGGGYRSCNGGYQNRDLSGEKLPPCYFSHRPSPRCPNCGAWYDMTQQVIKSIAGELTETDKPKRREFTDAETASIRSASDEMVKNAIRKGMPPGAARTWAIKKATQQMEERIDKMADISISLHADNKELEI